MHCGSCGQEIFQRTTPCPYCGFTLPPATGFASAHMDTPVPEITASGSRADVHEQRQLTLLSATLVQEQRLKALLTPDQYHQVLSVYHHAWTGVIRRFGGSTSNTAGQEQLAYFGYPFAHEDDTQRALHAAIAFRDELSAHVAQLSITIPVLPRDGLQVSIGIATGMTAITKRDDEQPGTVHLGGLALTVATRLRALASPHTILLSGTTYQLIEGFFSCRCFGLQELQDVPEPVVLYQLIGASQSKSRFDVALARGLSPLVGRNDEVTALVRLWKDSCAGQGRVAMVRGEAGVGKSRLVQALKEQITEQPYIPLECRCSASEQHSAFAPIAGLLKKLLAFTPDDTPEIKLLKLTQCLEQDELARPDITTLLATFLSLPLPSTAAPLNLTPQGMRQFLLSTLLTWIESIAKRVPVLLIVEDVHWSDPSTLELLSLLLPQQKESAILSVLTFRPEFQPPWSEASHLTQIVLPRLSRSYGEQIVTALAAGRTLPAELLTQILEKTDGIPLFIEEFTRMVLHSNWLRAHEDHYELVAPLTTIPVPATLQELLMAKLDTLAETKEIVQLAAVIGRDFSHNALRAASALENEPLQMLLFRLIENDILSASVFPNQMRYVFRHALIQDAAYALLPEQRRRAHHHRIAEVLEEQFPDTVRTQPEIVARHYTEADIPTKAISYWLQAGQQALARSANLEAISHLNHGLRVLQTLPETAERIPLELQLQMTVGVPLMVTKGFAAPEVETAYARALTLCHTIGETPHILPALWGLCAFHEVRADLATAQRLADRILPLAAQSQNSDFLAAAHYAVSSASFFQGSFLTARQHAEQGLVAYDPQHHLLQVQLFGQDIGVTISCYAAMALWLLGYSEQAQQRVQEALILAEQLSHTHSQVYPRYFSALIAYWGQDWLSAQTHIERAIALAAEQGLGYWLLISQLLDTRIRAERVDQPSTYDQIRQLLEAVAGTGALLGRSMHIQTQSEVCLRVGAIDAGLQANFDALTHVTQTGERWYEAEVYRIKGELLLQQEVRSSWTEAREEERPASSVQCPVSQDTVPHPLIPNPQGEAEACFLKAIAIAQEQQAKAWELRAVMSLARLWYRQGRSAEARQRLSDIYQWFTEGFATADLVAAKTLLAEL